MGQAAGSVLKHLPDSTFVTRVHLAAQRTAVRLGELLRVRYRTDYSAHHQQHASLLKAKFLYAVWFEPAPNQLA